MRSATAFESIRSLQHTRETLRVSYNHTVRRLAALPVPPPPSIYDSRCELGHLLLDQVKFLRQVIDAVAAVFERAADDAADYAGARAESFDLVRAALEDFVAPITDAAERLVDGD